MADFLHRIIHREVFDSLPVSTSGSLDQEKCRYRLRDGTWLLIDKEDPTMEGSSRIIIVQEPGESLEDLKARIRRIIKRDVKAFASNGEIRRKRGSRTTKPKRRKK